MKITRYFIIGLMLVSTLLVGCEKDTIVDEDDTKEPTPTEPVEVLPPDDEDVFGIVVGDIDEAEFNELKSTTSVTTSRIPHSLPKFLELRDQIAHTPQGAAVMMLVAMRIYQQYPIEGMKCLTAACTTPLIVPSDREGNYDGFVMGNISELKLKLASYGYLPFVYYEGASPSNSYTPNGPPYTANLKVNIHSYMPSTDGSLRIKLFFETEAADSPRPVVVRKIGEYYKITEYSSLYLAPKPIIP